MLQIRFRRLGFKPSGDPALFMAEFADWMSDLEDGDIVLLIDEYDAPLAKVINDEKLFLGVSSLNTFCYMRRVRQNLDLFYGDQDDQLDQCPRCLPS